MKTHIALALLLMTASLPAEAQTGCPEFLRFLRSVDARNPPPSLVIPGASKPISDLPATAYAGMREQLYRCLVFGDIEETNRLGNKIDVLTERARAQDRGRTAARDQSAERDRREAEDKRAEADAKRSAQQEADDRQRNDRQAEANRKADQEAAQRRAEARERAQLQAELSARAREEQDEQNRQAAKQMQLDRQRLVEEQNQKDKKLQEKIAKFCPSLTPAVRKMAIFMRDKLGSVGLMTQAGDRSGACAELGPAIENVQTVHQTLISCAKAAGDANENDFSNDLLNQASMAMQGGSGLTDLYDINRCKQ